MGDPRLLEPARPVERFDTQELHALIADMDDTMRARDGAGLAAPQIGVGLQVMTILGCLILAIGAVSGTAFILIVVVLLIRPEGLFGVVFEEER